MNLDWHQSNVAQRNLQDKIAGSPSEGLCLSLVNKANKTGLLFPIGNMGKSYCLIELSLPAEKREFISSSSDLATNTHTIVILTVPFYSLLPLGQHCFI